MRNLAAFASGVLFALGLVVSGMTQPAKIVGFLDVAGAWDPALGFVMAGAIAVYLPGYRLLVAQARPLADTSFHVPTRSDVTAPLVVGSALFGLGWGLAGYCPGPAITAAPTLSPNALAVMGGMTLAFVAAGLLQRGQQVDLQVAASDG